MRSDSLSRADVASSSSSTAGLRTRARAIATRCFCPPESLPPPSPTCVAYPAPKLSVMNVCAFAIRAAASTSSSDAPGLPYAMFSLTVPMNSTGSWPTRPSRERSQRRLSSLTSTPSSITLPDDGS